MISVFDVAKYILSKKNPISAMTLQKLVYYCQAWSIVWDGAQLFKEDIEAWANGPVVRALFNAHKGKYMIKELPTGNVKNLSLIQKETIDAVLKFYGGKSPLWLSDLTHREEPWLKARKGISDGERGTSKISLASMEEYYSSLQPK